MLIFFVNLYKRLTKRYYQGDNIFMTDYFTTTTW